MVQVFGKIGVVLGCAFLLASPVLSDVMFVSQATVSRRATVVRVSSPRDVINRFSPSTAIYIQGNPVSARDIDRLQQLVERHPNLFLVLVEYSSNLAQDQTAITEAVSRHPGFLSVRNRITNEREGVLITVYFGSNEGRRVFFLTDQLPDRLNVGENNPELLEIFRATVQSGGDIATAIERVISRINGRIRQAVGSAVQSQPIFAQVTGGRNNRGLLLGIGVGVGILLLGGHAWSISYTGKKRKEAIGLFPDIERKLRQKTEELLELMQTADFNVVANYAGETGAIVQKAVNDLNDCLLLLEMGKKILAEAKAIIDRKDILSQIYPFAATKAIKLLTDRNTQYRFTPTESPLVAGAGVGWQEQLANYSRETTMEKSFPDLMEELVQKQRQSHQVLTEVMQKDAEIAGFLTQIEEKGKRLIPIVQPWQRASSPEFTARQLWQTLIPNVIGEQGLIAEARQMMQRDPVGVWNRQGKTAERMLQEAERMIAICQQAQSVLIPQTQQTEQMLASNGITTNWLVNILRQLSDRLETFAVNSLNSPCGEGLAQLEQDIVSFREQQQQAIAQDEQRRVILPQQIRDTENIIINSRQEISSIYRQRGISFTEQQVLVETDRNPSHRVTQAQQELLPLKESLDRGDVQRAATCINKIEGLLKDARDICSDSLTFLNNYTNESNKIKNYKKSVTDKIPLTYRPIADRLQQTYHPDALALVANELECPPTVANILDRVDVELKEVERLTQEANDRYEQGWLLTSRDLIQTGTQKLQGIEVLLEKLPRAEQLLQKKQQEARQAIQQMENDIRYTLDRRHEFYAREQARNLCSRLEIQRRDVNNIITLTPQNPYRVEELILQIRQTQADARRLLDEDQEAWRDAERAIEEAERELSYAESAISQARSASFTYARVNYHRYNVDDESYELREIRSSFNSKAFESARSRAESLAHSLRRITEEAERAIEEARREDERQRSYYSSSSSDYGGSSGGSWESSSSSSDDQDYGGSRGGSW
ncbi:MAG: hypothetical protein RMK91_01290 [Pseudanabaenaceae cyanobacterium SKYGB_i_bin29]|nr:hypothetical protein [Pseudanabaenaceae cyanobacterium SKYG29]MDW8420482.1 hypothetical protein [Pseudanabaenaceae cyanobacterium SKYGB_i_bin29]